MIQFQTLRNYFPSFFSGYFGKFILFTVTCVVLKIVIETIIQYVMGEKPLKISDIDINTNGVLYPVSYWTDIGYRPYQEDRYVALSNTPKKKNVKGKAGDKSSGRSSPKLSKEKGDKQPSNISIYGVFDGHGGLFCSEFCKRYLCQAVIHSKNYHDIHQEPTKAEDVLREAIHRTNREFCAKFSAKSLVMGSTAVVALVHNKHVTVANVGDSRCIIVQRGGRTVPLSNDHKPNRPDEMRRISALGGKVTFKNIPRVEGVLAVSRALGDMKLHPYVTCEPEFTARRLEPNDLFMVMASDGLWDVMTNEDVGRFVHKKYLTFSRDVGPTASAASPKKYYKQFVYLAKQLCEEASILGSGDNITVQVIDLSSAHES